MWEVSLLTGSETGEASRRSWGHGHWSLKSYWKEYLPARLLAECEYPEAIDSKGERQSKESDLGLLGASPVAQMVKNLPAMPETWVRSLRREDPLEKERATHSSILALRIPQTEEPGRLQSMGSKESDTVEVTNTFTHWTSSLQNCKKVKYLKSSIQHVVCYYGSPGWLIQSNYQCPWPSLLRTAPDSPELLTTVTTMGNPSSESPENIVQTYIAIKLYAKFAWALSNILSFAHPSVSFSSPFQSFLNLIQSWLMTINTYDCIMNIKMAFVCLWHPSPTLQVLLFSHSFLLAFFFYIRERDAPFSFQGDSPLF